MKEEIRYRHGAKEDLNDIKALLTRAALPITDIDEVKIDFVVAINDKDELVGCVGLEQYGSDGFLRSLAVEKDYRNNQTGRGLLYRLFALSKELGINDLHLLTTTAEKFFLAAGFETLSRNNAPETIKATSEFSSICPSSSIYMILRDIQKSESAFWKNTKNPLVPGRR